MPLMVRAQRVITSCFLLASSVAVTSCGGAPDAEELGRTEEALGTFPNEQPAFDFFLAKGLTPVQSAGIVGNLDVESGVDPTVVQSGGPGRGIAQWSAGGRWDTSAGDNVKAYAAQKGQSATSLQLQLDFIWFELETFPAYGLASLQKATTTSAAVSAFESDFEGCSGCGTSMRVAYADSVLSRFGTDAPNGSVPSTPCTLSSGETGVCISTSECAAQGHHVSTPGFCPGSSEIQCCTSDGTTDGNEAGGATGAGDAGSAASNHKNGTALASSASENSGCAAAPARTHSGTGTGTALLLGAVLLRRRRRQ